MKFLAVAVFLVAVACASGSGIGLPLVASRGALEGALGGQWIPDVPVGAAPLAAPLAGPLATPWAAPLATPWASPLAVPLAAPWAAPLAGPAIVAPAVSARGALEGALGGQWIPDVPAH